MHSSAVKSTSEIKASKLIHLRQKLVIRMMTHDVTEELTKLFWEQNATQKKENEHVRETKFPVSQVEWPSVTEHVLTIKRSTEHSRM
ncbi:hypothetical protein AVEN_72447-1 [Araneus ventricosus]|uniref:Uncharacterized protein n=1 Tax=Araneus ventricosus TaxID=182803 RepID=A0A4Y2H7B3_ARAVE|nr:hypothetical protein AVEN_72447-1 [Araneus ventricosus]